MKTRVSLAGVQYCDYLIAKLKVGMRLELYPESHNAYDKKAIAVYAGKHKIGYIKKGEIQSLLWKARRAKKNVLTKLIAYNKNNPTWYMLTVELDIPVILEEEGKFILAGNQTYRVTGDGSRYIKNLYNNALESIGDNQYL